MSNTLNFQVSHETTKVPFALLDAVTGASPTIIHATTGIGWSDELEEISSALNASFSLDSFRVAPNKVSPHDEIWQEIDRILAEWDASGQTYDLDDETLNDMRASSESRLDDLYGSTGWK